MNMIEAVKTCFQKYFTFRGRARRSEYWYWVLFTIIVSIIASLIDTVAFPVMVQDGVSPLDTLFALAFFIPGLSVTWRRLHDTGRSGWWYGGAILGFIVLLFAMGALMAGMGAIDTDTFSLSNDLTNGRWIPLAIMIITVIIWLILMLAFLIQDSQYGTNKYGPNPKDEGNASVFD